MASADSTKHHYRGLTAFGLTILVMAVGSFFPEQRLWGINWYSYFGSTGLALLIATGLAVPLMIFWISRFSFMDNEPTPPESRLYPVTAFLIILSFGLAFYFLRGRTHFLGDGYQLLDWLGKSIHFKPWEAGSFWVQDQMLNLVGRGDGQPLLALQLVSYLSGLVLLITTAYAAARLFATTLDRTLFLLGVGTGGYMLLFFGYLESYPLFAVSVGLYCLTGLLVTRGGWSRWTIMIPLVLAGMFHIFAVALLPGALYIVFRGTTVGRKISSLKLWQLAAAGGILEALGLVAFFHFYQTSYFFRFTIVPLLPDRYTVDGYWMFSIAHLLDYANQLLLLFPGLFLLGRLMLLPGIRKQVGRPDNIFLLSILIPALAMTFMFNPGLGMPRDWDLFSFGGLSLVFLFYNLALNSGGNFRNGRMVAMLGIGLGLIVLAPRIMMQVQPDLSIALFDNYASLDRVKNSSGRFVVREYLTRQGRTAEAERRRLIDNQLLPEGEWIDKAHQMILDNRLDIAVPLLQKALKSDPSAHMGWANLGAAYARIGELDTALTFMKIADARMPFNPGIHANLGGVYKARKDYDLAEEAWLEATRLKPSDLTSSRQLILLYEEQAMPDKYSELLTRLAADTKAPPDILIRLADLKLDAGDMLSATQILRRALKAGLDPALVCDRQSRFSELSIVNCQDN